MPFNTKPIKKDLENKPIPQYFNPATDDFEDLRGRNGASYVELVGANGVPLATPSGKLAVRCAELEAELGSIKSELAEIKSRLRERMDYYGKSTDPRPTNVPIGATFFIIDTQAVEMWDGVQWVVL